MIINEEAVNVVQNGAVPMERAQAVQIVHSLSVDGLLTPAPQIIRTDDDYEALDPDSLVLDRTGRVDTPINMWRVPAVVVASGETVRACREALEGGVDG